MEVLRLHDYHYYILFFLAVQHFLFAVMSAYNMHIYIYFGIESEVGLHHPYLT